MTNAILRLAVAVLFTAALDRPADAQVEKAELQLVGALHCSAALADRQAAPPATRLDCQLRLTGASPGGVTYTGEMVGSGLYLVDPGGVRVMWEVWAPTSALDRMALAGDYDIVTDHNYAKPKGSDNTLFGGLNDSVALVLVAPNVNAVRASTRLTLTAH